MKQYIDKSALVAEIEKELNTTKKYSTEYVNGKKYALNKILSFLDTLEMKEVEEEPISKDLEEAAKNYEEDAIFYAARRISDFFKAGAKWQKTKACDWLKINKDHPLIGCEDPCLSGYLTDEFIEDFKKAMEDKT